MKTRLPAPPRPTRLAASLALVLLLAAAGGADGHFWGATGGPSPVPAPPAAGTSGPPPEPDAPRNMTVYLWADSCMKEAAADASLAFTRANPWARVVPRFATAGEIERRIRGGEEADLVLLDAGTARRLAGDGLLTGDSVSVVGRNPLVFAGREGARARRIADLPAVPRILAAEPAANPSGRYALEALRNSVHPGAAVGEDEEGKEPPDPSAHLSATAPDARAALESVERGEADGAFAFRSDAAAVPSVRVLFVVPRTLYGSPDVAVALSPTGGGNDGAICLFRFLRSPEGRRSLARQGIEPCE